MACKEKLSCTDKKDLHCIEHTCFVQNVVLTKACPVDSCMWHSKIALSGCMVSDGVDPHTTNIHVVAIHKDLSLRQIRAYKKQTDNAISDLAKLVRLFDWAEATHSGKTLSGNPPVINRWPFNEDLLNWKPWMYTVIIDKRALRAFNKRTGQNTDWPRILQLTTTEESILKSLEKP